MRILVVEDEPRLLRNLAKSLREEGYAVDTAEDGDDGLYKAQTCDYDAVVLDVMLPRLDGWELLRRLREHKKTPVLMLTARDATRDRVRGLDTGADDYLVKPFDLTELLARLRALIRRAAGQARSNVELRDVVLDTRARTVTRDGQPVTLTGREYAILEYLALHRGEVVTRSALYEHLFDESDDTLSNLVDVHVFNIRKKLGADLIATRRGHGLRHRTLISGHGHRVHPLAAPTVAGFPAGFDPERLRHDRLPAPPHQSAPPDRRRTRTPPRCPRRRCPLLSPAGSSNGYYYAVWSRGRALRLESTNSPAELSHPGPPPTVNTVHTRSRNSLREAYLFTEIGECVLVGRSIAADLTAVRRFAGWLVVAGGGVLALGLGGGWLLASRALRPIETISAAASRISAGNLSERIDVADTDSELGRLAGVLNSTFARLEAAFAQQTQFTTDASHELRTPLAVIISEAQTALSRERTPAEYRETIEACLETARQMTRLTESLLELARYDAGEESLERRPFDLAERARACIELVRPLARTHGIQIHSVLEPVQVLGDADRVGQVITNLLSNAIDHNRNQGDVEVTVRADPNVALLSVVDRGPGIAAEDLPHVFERFFRGDKSRARAGGHNGLGLAIGKAIVEAHGGSIEASSEPGAGAQFTVRLPRPEAVDSRR